MTQSCYTRRHDTGGQCDSSFYRPGASFKAWVTRVCIGNVLRVCEIVRQNQQKLVIVFLEELT